MDDNLTREQIAERVEWLKDQARKGSDRLHATATTLDKRHQPTPTEELARARARADRQEQR